MARKQRKRHAIKVLAFCLGATLLNSSCGRFTGETAYLWPVLSELLKAPPVCSSELPSYDVTIDAVPLGLSADVHRFPVLIRLTLTNFPDIATHTEAGGANLRFRTSQTSGLPYEIEAWTDNSSGSVWVLVDTVSSTQPTTIQMCYAEPGSGSHSNPAAVFSPANGFAGVWHMDPTLSDATGNGHNGVDIATFGPPGLIGPARQFTVASSSAILVPGLLGQPSSITVSAWVNLTARDTFGAEAVSLGNAVVLRAADAGYFDHAGATYALDASNWNNTGAPDVILAQGWKYVSYVAEVGNQIVYIDATNVGQTSHLDPISYGGLGSDTYFGRHGNGDTVLDFGGQLDEIRVSNTVRSADWTKLDFESQRSGSSLITITPL